MSTISDVARVAGVSVATVSRALRGIEGVSPTTRDRVLLAAAELDYVASPTASSLASGRTKVVGVVTPFLTRWFFASLISAIEKSLRDDNHYVLLFDLEEETYDRRRPLTQSMLWKRVDGLITLNVPLRPEELDLLDRLTVPLVAVGIPVPGCPCVRIDDTLAIERATEHVVALGHRRIAYVGAVPATAAHVRVPLDRLESFEAVMARHGLDVPPRWVLAADWTAAGAAHEVASILRCDDRPTAVVCASDEMAIGVISESKRAGLRVPEDLSVIGVDDFELSSALDLTTIRQDIVRQGQLAAELLLEGIAERAADPDGTALGERRWGRLRSDGAPTEEVVVDTELVVRASTTSPTAPPRATASPGP